MDNPVDPEVAMAAAILRLVQNDSLVYDQLGGRVNIAEPVELKNVDLPAVCFRVYGAGGNLQVGDRTCGMQVWSFSAKSYDEASSSYRLFRNAVSGMRLARDGVNGIAKERRTPTWNHDDVNQDFVCTALWEVHMTEPIN